MPDTLPDVVIALVHVATRGGSVRIRTVHMTPVDLLAFHFFRCTWPPSRGIRWTVAPLEN